jgi:hypothetical protein
VRDRRHAAAESRLLAAGVPAAPLLVGGLWEMTSRRARFVLQIYWSKGLYRPRMYLIQDEIIRRVKDVPVHHHPTHFCLACWMQEFPLSWPTRLMWQWDAWMEETFGWGVCKR